MVRSASSRVSNHEMVALSFETPRKSAAPLAITAKPLRGDEEKSDAALLFVRTVEGMSVQPLLVLEKGAQRQRNLPMLVSFRARWECPGVTENIAPVFD